MLQAGDWVQAQIDSMDPHILTIGLTLEEAKRLRKEHMELIEKLQVSLLVDNQTVCELLASTTCKQWDNRSSCYRLP